MILPEMSFLNHSNAIDIIIAGSWNTKVSLESSPAIEATITTLLFKYKPKEQNTDASKPSK